MKSFYEFYQKIRQFNEDDTMVPPNMGLGAQGPAGMMPPPGGAPQMGGAPGMAPTGFNMGQEVGTMQQDDSGGGNEGRTQTAPPEGDSNVSDYYGNIEAMLKFVNDFQTEDKDLKDALLSALDTVKENLASLTGTQPPENPDNEEGDASVGSNEIPTTPDQIPPGTQTPYGGSFGDSAGNQFPSNGSGSGDMGGNMDGGSNASTTGPGSLGFGGMWAG